MRLYVGTVLVSIQLLSGHFGYGRTVADPMSKHKPEIRSLSVVHSVVQDETQFWGFRNGAGQDPQQRPILP